VIDDLFVHGSTVGSLRLRDDTPEAYERLAAAAKGGGDILRLVRAIYGTTPSPSTTPGQKELRSAEDLEESFELCLLRANR